MKYKIAYIGNKLAKLGYNPSTIDTLGILLENEGFDLVYASSKKGQFLRLFDMLFTIFRNRKIVKVVLMDTYSTNAFYFVWLCSRLCKILKMPYIPILHGGNLPYRIKTSPKIARQVFGESRVNVLVSRYLEKTMIDNEFKYKIIFNNINLQEYIFKKRVKIAPKLLWVRSFHAIYNPQMAIYVLKKLLEKYPDAQLTMVGPDKDNSLEDCKLLVQQLGINSQVTFTGKLPKKDWLLLSAEFDVFINTSNHDNLPVSIIEALALGMPVVSTNIGGIPFFITDGENGILANPNDVDKFAEVIFDLLSNPHLTEKLSLNAKKSADAFDWENIKGQWKELLTPFVMNS